ncbi:d-alanyl-D-alanine carboxypeptidase [Clostridium sp. CAG:245]|nr:d-alanyl-D-alanine carboxypeptidase [Clostridium sp. CAG:245]
MKKILYSILIFLLILLNFSTVCADDVDNEVDFEDTIEVTASNVSELPKTNSRRYIVYDRISKSMIIGKNEDVKSAMASTTKIMTTIVILEKADLNEKVTVSAKAGGTGGSRLGLKRGDKASVRDLLYGLMLRSGNDAAVALAEHVGGSVKGFAELMNEKAIELGLTNTHFVTPHGLDDANHYTTALELAKLTDYAMDNETFAKIVGTKSTTIYINNQSRQINNTNELLGVLNGVVGVKTGFTNNAGRCLVTETKRNNMDIITIVLGADTKKDRTKDSVNLIEYTFSKYKMCNLEEQIIKEFNKWKNINEKRILIIKGKTSNPKLALGAIEKATIPICDNDKIEYSINALTEVEAPVEQWNVMGTLTVKLNGEILENIDIVNVNEVQKRDWKDYFKIVLNRFEDMGKMLINQQI